MEEKTYNIVNDRNEYINNIISDLNNNKNIFGWLYFVIIDFNNCVLPVSYGLFILKHFKLSF